VSTTACPHCASTNTIQTDHGRDYVSWYCYDCRKAFELYNGPAPLHPPRAERRKSPDRRTNRSAARVNDAS